MLPIACRISFAAAHGSTFPFPAENEPVLDAPFEVSRRMKICSNPLHDPALEERRAKT